MHLHLLAIMLFVLLYAWIPPSSSLRHCSLQSAAPRPTSRGGLLFHGTHRLPDLRGNRGLKRP